MVERKQHKNTVDAEPADTIIILISEYKELLKESEKLRRLENGGVDNWDWYGASLYPEGEKGYDVFCEEIDKS